MNELAQHPSSSPDWHSQSHYFYPRETSGHHYDNYDDVIVAVDQEVQDADLYKE